MENKLFVLAKDTHWERKVFFGENHTQVLADQDNGKPLLFASENDANTYFNQHSDGRTLDEMQCYIREANEYELSIGIVQTVESNRT